MQCVNVPEKNIIQVITAMKTSQLILHDSQHKIHKTANCTTEKKFYIFCLELTALLMKQK